MKLLVFLGCLLTAAPALAQLGGATPPRVMTTRADTLKARNLVADLVRAANILEMPRGNTAGRPTCSSTAGSGQLYYDTQTDHPYVCIEGTWTRLDFSTTDVVSVDLSNYPDKTGAESITGAWDFSAGGLEMPQSATFNCDDNDEEGRVYFDTDNDRVYVCTRSGGSGTLKELTLPSGRAIGTNIQAYDADLADLADGDLTASKVGADLTDDVVVITDADGLVAWGDKDNIGRLDEDETVAGSWGFAKDALRLVPGDDVATQCDAAGEEGRIMYDSSTNSLFVCSDAGGTYGWTTVIGGGDYSLSGHWNYASGHLELPQDTGANITCNADNEGRIYYKTDEDRVYVCTERFERQLTFPTNTAIVRLSGTWEYSAGGIELPQASSLTCSFDNEGRIFYDTTDNEVYVCTHSGTVSTLKQMTGISNSANFTTGTLELPQSSVFSCGSTTEGYVYYDTDNDNVFVCAYDTNANTGVLKDMTASAGGGGDATLANDESVTGAWNFSGGGLELPQSSALTCADADDEGRIHLDTDDDRLYVCTYDGTNATLKELTLPSGRAIGTNIQAYDADLADLADGDLTASKVGADLTDDVVVITDAGGLTAWGDKDNIGRLDESEAVAGTWDFSGGGLEMPQSAALTCSDADDEGRIHLDTDNNNVYVCTHDGSNASLKNMTTTAGGSGDATLADNESVTGNWSFSGGGLELPQSATFACDDNNEEGRVYFDTDNDNVYVCTRSGGNGTLKNMTDTGGGNTGPNLGGTESVTGHWTFDKDGLRLRPGDDVANQCDTSGEEGRIMYDSARNRVLICNDADGSYGWDPIVSGGGYTLTGLWDFKGASFKFPQRSSSSIRCQNQWASEVFYTTDEEKFRFCAGNPSGTGTEASEFKTVVTSETNESITATFNFSGGGIELPQSATFSCGSGQEGRVYYDTDNDQVYVCTYSNNSGTLKHMTATGGGGGGGDATLSDNESVTGNWSFSGGGLELPQSATFSCNSAAVEGRVYYDTDNDNVYVCTRSSGSGTLKQLTFPGSTNLSVTGNWSFASGGLELPQSATFSCGSGQEGRVYYDTDNDQVYVCTYSNNSGTLKHMTATGGGGGSTLVVGTDVQAYDADLDDLADGDLTASKVGADLTDDVVVITDSNGLKAWADKDNIGRLDENESVGGNWDFSGGGLEVPQSRTFSCGNAQEGRIWYDTDDNKLYYCDGSNNKGVTAVSSQRTFSTTLVPNENVDTRDYAFRADERTAIALCYFLGYDKPLAYTSATSSREHIDLRGQTMTLQTSFDLVRATTPAPGRVNDIFIPENNSRQNHINSLTCAEYN